MLPHRRAGCAHRADQVQRLFAYIGHQFAIDANALPLQVTLHKARQVLLRRRIAQCHCESPEPVRICVRNVAG